MKKEELRFLALGFFISALLLAAFQLISPSPSASTAKEEVTEKKDDFQEKYESLLVEHQQLEKSLESQEESTSTEGETESEVESEEKPESEETEVPDEEPSSASPTSIVFLVHDGQPSSVVLQNLLEAGLISSLEAAEQYLTDQDLMTRIQVGSYELSPEMSDEEVLTEITIQ
ncbi:hypothetical protein [Jeotgalibaca caeni]|uniref:hypothetical protein n=1 Tax=Jeotgalibaca caeni TaxID=3028623 RepID=UPI00237DF083|nr:hypothetical protein [Jeotgalibaca caeni]MDE1549736.1 hypothetical protein [Jeotgalibaca caeni]